MVQLTGTGTSKRAKWCWRWCGCRCGCIDGADVLIRDSVSLGARLVHGLCIMHHRLRNHYGSTRL